MRSREYGVVRSRARLPAAFASHAPRAQTPRMHSFAITWFISTLAASPAPTPAIDAPLRATLIRMAQDDQEAVRIATADPTRELTAAESKQVHDIATRNAGLIRQIVQEHGWPRIGLVGADGSSAAWLVVQHMDYDVDFQRSCLDLMEQAFAAGRAWIRGGALSKDRQSPGYEGSVKRWNELVERWNQIVGKYNANIDEMNRLTNEIVKEARRNG